MGYWDKRQQEMYEAGEMMINQYFSKLEKAFLQTQRELQRTINDFYTRYATENHLSFADAQKALDRAEIGELRDFIALSMQNIGKHNQTVNNMSIKARITRYQAMEAQVDAMLRQLYAINYQYHAEKTMSEIYKNAYYRTWYNIDRYRGFHSNFAQIDPETVDALLAYPFNGANFSSRLWKQKEHLQTQLMESLTTILVQGKPPHALVEEFAKSMKSKRFDAYRLLHTESSYLISQATHAAYREDGVEKYQILATLDNKTCGICGDVDGNVFDVDKAVVGDNMPPFHCFCRCTDIPCYEEMDDSDNTREARATGTDEPYEVPADMTYREWKKSFADGVDDELYEQYVDTESQGDVKDLFVEVVNKINDHEPKGIDKLPKKYKDYINSVIDSAPQPIKEFTLSKIDDVKIINEKYLGRPYTTKKGIRFNLKEQVNDKRGSYTAFFHEIGHRLDTAYGDVSALHIFKNSLQDDFNDIVNSYCKYYNVGKDEAFIEIGKTLKGAKFHSVSDLCGGLTDNKCVGQYKHDTDYWKNTPNALEKEAFAHFYEATIRSDADKLNAIKQMFPSAYRIFEEMLR